MPEFSISLNNPENLIQLNFVLFLLNLISQYNLTFVNFMALQIFKVMNFKFYLSFILIIAALSGFAQVISTFDTNTDNWHSEGDGDYYWEAATGNPGGCFRVDDDATGDWNNAFAPVKFLR